MTDGGKMARRSARVFADEYQPSQEMVPTENGHVPGIREREEKLREKSRSRGSSCSSVSLVNFEMDMHASVLSKDSGNEVTPVRAVREKIKGRPVNFGTVIPDLFYRSGYPQTEDHEYLKSLGLKTIITLVQKDYPEGYQLFMETNGIKHVVIDVQGTKEVTIPLSVINSILEVVSNHQNYPLLMHCNHGKHRTGCVVAVFRKAIGWPVDAIVEEYITYAYPKSRETDINYIQGFDIETLSVDCREPAQDITSRITRFDAISRSEDGKDVGDSYPNALAMGFHDSAVKSLNMVSLMILLELKDFSVGVPQMHRASTIVISAY